MLQFIIGTKGAGKTVYTHRLLGTHVKYESADVMLIVPKQFTFDTDKGILDTLGPKDACKVDVLSFMRLADEIIKQCGGLKNPLLTDGADAVLMQIALDNIKDKLSFYSRHCSSISFIKKMLQEIKILKQNVITPQELDLAAKMLPSGILRQKAIETSLIYGTYDSLVKQSFFDDSDILSVVYNMLLESNFFNDKIVAIDAFSRFSGQELKLIERMLVSAKQVYITACTDDETNIDDSSPFAQVNQTVRRIKAIAADHGVRIAQTIKITDIESGFSTYSTKYLEHLQKNLFISNFESLSSDTDSVNLCSAATPREECDFAARKIKSLLRCGKYRSRDIAVVYRSPDPYEDFLRRSLKKYGVPMFEDKRQPIENEPLIIAVRSLLDINASGFSTDSLMRYAKTGLTGIDRNDLAQVENYALMWDIGSKQWRTPWKDNPDGFGVTMDSEREERLNQINRIRAGLVEPIEALCVNLKDADGKTSMEALYNFLIKNGVDENLKQYAIRLEELGKIELAVEQEQVWDLTMVVFDRIATALGERKVNAKRLLEIFDLVVSIQSLGKLPDGFDQVHICDADRMQTKTAKVVFILGANSGVFPADYTTESIFAESEKDKLRQFLPEMKDGVRNSAVLERFLVYNAVAAAREKLYVCRSFSAVNGEKLLESEFYTSIAAILPNCTRININETPLEDLIESKQAAFELMAKLWNENTPQANALKQYFFEKEEYREKIEAIKRAANHTDFAFKSKQTAKKLFGENLSLSASRIEDYEKCPYLYFCKYGLKAYPRKAARLDPAQSGTLVHFVLERLLGEYKGDKLIKASPKEIDEKLQLLLDEYINTYMGGREGRSKRFEYLYNRTLKTLKTIVSRLLCEFENSDFVPCDFELKIGPGEEIKPQRIELEEGYINFYGIIDRVDKMIVNGKTYIRVVDYKTGAKIFSLSDVLSGLGMQMLLYLVAIWRDGEKYYGDKIVPAGVLYVPARFEPYTVERGDSEEIQEQKKLDSGKMDGMILEDETVIKGMDKELCGRFIPITKNKRTGDVTGTFIGLEQLGYLAKKMDSIMEQMGNSLHDGKIPANPVYGSDHMNTCDYCDYKRSCLISLARKGRYIEKLNHRQSLDKLEEEYGDKKMD